MAWWAKLGIDPITEARTLWLESPRRIACTDSLGGQGR
jgi:hypothetical protein